MNEETLIKTMPLPYSQEWAWYADANLVVLAPCLDAAGRERALNEVQAHWRRSCLRVLGDAEAAVRSTQPLNAAVEPNWSPARPGSTIRYVVETL